MPESLKYESNITLDHAAGLLAQSRRVLVTTHAKPDGDAFGSAVALTAALRRLGVEADAAFMPPVPDSFDTLRGRDMATVVPSGSAPTAADAEPDRIVVVDTGAWSQLAPLRDWLQPRLDRVLLLDHHLSGDVQAASRFIDGASASTAEIIAELLGLLPAAFAAAGRARIDGDELFNSTVCDALFVGIASDTGWFRFSNTTPRTHDWAARLQRRGVDPADLFQRLEQTERPQKLKLMIRALDSLELLKDDSVALMTLRAEDFRETGARAEETERLIDLPQMVATVQVVILITDPPPATDAPDAPGAPEAPPGPVRISFRSKPGPHAVNVADLAGRFGGGGHARAAGAKVDAPLADVVRQVRDAVCETA